LLQSCPFFVNFLRIARMVDGRRRRYSNQH
jgi:hypothetical protein